MTSPNGKGMRLLRSSMRLACYQNVASTAFSWSPASFGSAVRAQMSSRHIMRLTPGDLESGIGPPGDSQLRLALSGTMVCQESSYV
jgi:hypothetical protein